jgi:23S rRNA pseudouridine1911/1915/1917 synthase
MIRRTIHLPAGAPVRVDRWLAESIDDVSRRRLQHLLAEGAVRIDGRRARKGDLLHGDRTLDVEIRADTSAELPAELEPEIPVLFVDTECVAFNKPAGRPGHALRSGERGTVANFIAARFPECLAAGATPFEAGLVHRLDTGTSGVLLAARDRTTWQRLREQFREGTVGKQYLAVVAGAVAGGGEIRRPIEPHPKSRKRVRVLDEGRASSHARPAITRYRPRSSTSGATLLEVEIATGVRHQIRAHLAALGHPVLGDSLYGTGQEDERLLLHAHRLAFLHPRTARRIEVRCDPPDDFLEALRRLGFPPFAER